MQKSPQLVLRDAHPDELAAIHEVALAAYAQYATQMPHWPMYREGMLATLAKHEGATMIVAEQSGQIVGSVLFYPGTTPIYGTPSANAGWPEFRLLAVAPSARGQGVGQALVEECIRRARAMGAMTLGLHTEDLMAGAVRMYTRRGFVREPTTDFYPIPEVHVKGYRLELDASGDMAGQR